MGASGQATTPVLDSVNGAGPADSVRDRLDDPRVAEALIGKAPSPELFDRAADILLEDAQGFGENDFKIRLARRTLHAVLEQAVEEAS